MRTCSSAVRHWLPEGSPFDLHALGTPPALILSQDQTRQKDGEAYWLLTSPLRRPVWWGDDARRTRQLVRCGRQKSEWVAGRGEPTRLTVTLETSAPKRETVSLSTLRSIPCSPQRVKQVRFSGSPSEERDCIRREVVVADAEQYTTLDRNVKQVAYSVLLPVQPVYGAARSGRFRR